MEVVQCADPIRGRLGYSGDTTPAFPPLWAQFKVRLHPGLWRRSKRRMASADQKELGRLSAV